MQQNHPLALTVDSVPSVDGQRRKSSLGFNGVATIEARCVPPREPQTQHASSTYIAVELCMLQTVWPQTRRGRESERREAGVKKGSQLTVEGSTMTPHCLVIEGDMPHSLSIRRVGSNRFEPG